MDEKEVKKTVMALCTEVAELLEVYGKEYDFFYDETELALHVAFNLEHDADASFSVSAAKGIAGDVLVHTYLGQIVGFSVLYDDQEKSPKGSEK